MRVNNFHPNLQFFNNEKPQKSLGDISVESDSNNDSQDEKLNSIIKENYNLFPKENSLASVDISNSIPKINIPFNKNENANKRYSNNTNNKKIDDFSMMKRSTWSKENNRYSNIHEIYNNNLRFLSICESDYHEEDDDIVNFVNSEIHSQTDSNEKSTDYIKGFDTYYNFKNDNQIEVEIQPDISKLLSGEINDFPNDNIINNNNKNNNRYMPNKDKEKISILNIDDSKKENNIINNNNIKKENDNDKIIIKDNNIIKNVDINQSSDSLSINNDLRDSRKFFRSNSKIKSRAMTLLNLSIQNKIFQKFLSVSVDTSGLYSLEDEMLILLLNPKITYNYPFNKMERELE